MSICLYRVTNTCRWMWRP